MLCWCVNIGDVYLENIVLQNATQTKDKLWGAIIHMLTHEHAWDVMTNSLVVVVITSMGSKLILLFPAFSGSNEQQSITDNEYSCPCHHNILQMSICQTI